MCMGKQMILTVFIIAIAFGTETKFQIWIILLSSAADGTFMLCNGTILPGTALWLHSTAKFVASVNLFGIITLKIPRSQKINNKIQKGCNDQYSHKPGPHTDIADHLIYDHHSVENGHPAHLDRNNKIQHYPHIGERNTVCQEYRYTDIIGGKIIPDTITDPVVSQSVNCDQIQGDVYKRQL